MRFFLDLFRSARLALDELGEHARSAWRGRTVADEVECSQLESRVLLNAAPIAVIADLDTNVAANVEGASDPTVEAVNGALDRAAVAERDSSSEAGASEDEAVERIRRELVIVDPRASDYQQLLDGLRNDPSVEFEILVLDEDRDGVEQISETLSRQFDLDAVHVVSHGMAGQIQLGNVTLTTDSMDGYAGEIAGWSRALDENADLLIYGCDLANTENGRALAASIGALCDCDVAASDDDTGHTLLGGDWDLEFEVGGVETTVAFGEAAQTDWVGLLSGAPPSIVLSGNLSYTEGDGQAVIDSALTVSDPDDLDLQGATVRFVVGYTAPEDVLHFTDQLGISGSFDAGTGILTLTGTASVADYQTALRSVEYENTSINPNVASRSILFSVNDGTSVSGSALNATIASVGPLTIDTTLDVIDGDTTDLASLLANKGTDGYVSLREAVIAANNTPGADAFTLLPGTYALTRTGSGEDAGLTGDLDILDDLTITGAAAATTILDGAAISDRVLDGLAGTVTVNAVTIQNGAASEGAGVRVASGADWNIGQAVLVGNVSPGTGGAVNNAGALTLTDSRITGNSAPDGAGVFNGGDLTIDRSTIDGNTAVSTGGGIFSSGAGNSLQLTNSTLSGNSVSSGNGGAIRISHATAVLTNVTVIGNSAIGGGGIYTIGAGDASLQNTILASNSGGNSNSVLTSLGGNLDSGNTAGLAGPGDQVNTDPMLDPVLRDNGGFTPTHALLAGSPAIDAGIAAGAPAIDQRGVARSTVDVGSFEWNAAPSLWFSTAGDVSSSGVNGLNSWDEGEALMFGDPNLALGAGTSNGTAGFVFDLDAIADDGATNLNAIHYVNSAITVGGANAVNLLPGDVLFSTAADESFEGGAITLEREDVGLFRPASPGDYSTGTVSILLDDMSVGGLVGPDVYGITLVEQTVAFGETTLNAGDFLFTQLSDWKNNSVYLFETDDVGAGTTAGNSLNLIDGDDIGLSVFSSYLKGVHLVNSDTTIGGVTLTAGTLLLHSDGNHSVGSGNTGTTRYDVFSLDVTNTSLSGSAVVDASIFLRGADAGFNSLSEAFAGLTLGPSTTSGSPPTAIGDSYDLNQDVAIAVPVGTGLLANDSDPESQPLSAFLVSEPSNGKLVLNPTGVLGETNLSANAATDRTPKWSPDGTQLLFVSDRDGDDEVFVMDADGTNIVQLTTNSVDDYGASWSPDGSKIVFVSERDGNAEIYVMDANGANQTRATNDSSRDDSPEYSPDGAQFVFRSDRDGDWEIFTMDVDGSNLNQLTTNTVAEGAPAWSPDGSKIAYRSAVAGNNDVYVMDADGANSTSLTTDAASDGHPAWSLDGGKILFKSDRDGDNELFSINADGSGLTQLTTNATNETSVDWSPDGARLAYESDRDGNSEIYVAVVQSDGAFTYTPDVGFSGVDSFTYSAFDGSSGSIPAVVTLNVNGAPVADAGGSYIINEGDGLALDGTASSDDGTIAFYEWDLNNDGTYGDVTTATASLTWSGLAPWGITDGDVGGRDYTISLRITDDKGAIHVDTTTVTVHDVAPVVSATGSATALSGAAFTLNLLATDDGDDTISEWWIDWGDGDIETMAGNPTSVTHTYQVGGLSHNIVVSATDEDGTWFVNEIYQATANTTPVYQINVNGGVDGAFGSSASLDAAADVVFGADGLLYVSGYNTNNVQRFDPSTNSYVDEFVAPGSGGLSGATGIAFGPDGSLYVASYTSGDVMRYDGATGAFMDVFVSPGAGGLNKPNDIMFGNDGNLYVASEGSNQVLRYDGSTGAFVDVFVAAGNGLNSPATFAFGPDGNFYVASTGSHNVLRYDGGTGAFTDEFVGANSGGINGPVGLLWAPDGDLYVSAMNSDHILRFDGTTGAFVSEFVPASTGLVDPRALVMAPSHQVTVLDTSVYLAPVQDTSLNSNAATLNYGGSTSLVLDSSGGGLGDQRVALQFDLSSIPVGATIVNATLQMEATSATITGSLNLDVFELTQSWVEGSSDGTAGVANWTEREASTPWLSPGGDVSGSIATFSASGIGPYTWDVTSLAQGWYTGVVVNNGLLVASPDTGGDTVTFDSREGATPPELRLYYTVSNDPPTDISPNTFSILENVDTTGGAVLGTLSASDPDAGERFTFAVIGGADQSKFSISPSDELTIDDGVLDYESQASYDVIVRVTDSALHSYDEALTINVTNVDDSAPQVVTNAGSITVEGGTDGITSGELLFSDEQPAASIQFTVTVGPANGQLELTSAAGVAVTTFTQDDIDAGRLVYVHDGTDTTTGDFTFDVNDGQGNQVLNQSFTIGVTAVDDTPPVLVANAGSSVLEGGAVLIGASELAFSDSEQPVTSIHFTVTVGPANGRLELTTAAGVAVTAFTQDDLNAGRLIYIHDDTDTTSGDFTFDVDDGQGNQVSNQSFTIAVTAVDDTSPVVVANAGSSVLEGGSVLISASQLAFSDSEQPTTSIHFSVTGGPANGQLELTTAPGVAVTAFTQDDVDSGRLVYIHDGTDTTTGDFTFDVDDGQGNLVLNQGFVIAVTAVDDVPPVLVANAGSSVLEGGTVLISASELAFSDSEQPTTSIHFTVTGGPANGQLELTTAAGVAVTGFTQDDVDSGRLVYIHDGTDTTTGDFTFDVDDGQGNQVLNQSFTIAVTAVDDTPPVLVANAGSSVLEGGAVLISASELAFSDSEQPPTSINFTVTGGPANGQLELTTAAGVAATAFTQDDVDSGRLVYIHGGTDTTTGDFTFDVDDGQGNQVLNQSFTIAVTAVDDTPPVLVTNAGSSVLEGGTVLIAASELAFSDSEQPAASIQFTVTGGPANGQLELTTAAGVAVTAFTQDDLDGGRLVYVHNGTSTTIGDFTFDVDDGQGNLVLNQSFTIAVTAVDSTPPVLVANAGSSVLEGGTVLIAASELAFSDSEQPTNSINFTVTGGPANGQLELTTAAGVAVTAFTQDDVDTGRLVYVHDGTDTATGDFTFDVDDGQGNQVLNQSFTIGVTAVDDTPPVMVANACSSVLEGGTVLISTSELAFGDSEQSTASINFTVTGGPANGQLELTAAPGVGVTMFTQDDIDTGRVVYVHDGSNSTSGAFTFDVDDGQGNVVVGQAFLLGVSPVDDDAPTQLANLGSRVSHGGTDRISSVELTFVDSEQPSASVTFVVTSVSGGQLTLSSAPGTAVAMFTQADIANGQLAFIHDGTATTGGFAFDVNDGQGNAVHNQYFAIDVGSPAIPLPAATYLEVVEPETKKSASESEEEDELLSPPLEVQAASNITGSSPAAQPAAVEEAVVSGLAVLPSGFVTIDGEADTLVVTGRVTSSLNGDPVAASGAREIVPTSRSRFVYLSQQGELWQKLDDFHQDLGVEVRLESMIVGATVTVASTLTVGYVVWALRAGLLVSTMMASMPAWVMFDPLSVVQMGDEEEDQESLAEFVETQSNRVNSLADNERDGDQT